MRVEEEDRRRWNLPHSTQPVQQEKHPVKVSEGVLEAQLISRIEPHYPALALQTRTRRHGGLHAIISRDGRITSLDVLSGHPFLVKAALDAVRQWRYRPTMLNGEPVEVETSITVIFRLHEVTAARRQLKKGRRNRCFGPCNSRRGSSPAAPGQNETQKEDGTFSLGPALFHCLTGFWIRRIPTDPYEHDGEPHP